METNSKTDFRQEIERKSGQTSYEIIDDPSSCIIKDQIDVDIIKLLWICPDGEQKVITSDERSDDCTVQDLLDAAGIPMCEGSIISLITDPTIEFNYAVNSLLRPNDGTARADSSSGFCSSLDENCSNFKMNENKKREETNKKQKEMFKLESEGFRPSKKKRKRKPSTTSEDRVFGNLERIYGITSDEEDQNKVEISKKPGVKDNRSMRTDVDNARDEIDKKTIIHEESVITNNNSVVSINELDADREGSIKGEGVPYEAQNMVIDSSIQAPYTSLICSTIMIGSHIYTPEERVIISRSGMTLRAPVIKDDTNFVLLKFEFEDIVKVVPHFPEPMPVLFFYIDINVADKIRESLNMNDPRGPYYHPMSGHHTQRRLVFILKEISEESIFVLRTLFSQKDKVLEELTSSEAANLLLSSSPRNILPQVQSMIKKLKRVSSTVDVTVKNGVKTRAKTAQSARRISEEIEPTVESIVKDEIKPILEKTQSLIQITDESQPTLDSSENTKIEPTVKQRKGLRKRSKELASIVYNPGKDESRTLLVYPPPPASGGIPITAKDYACLRQSHFLNDIIIDFYLRYLILEVLSQEDRDRTHIFSTHFYKRLTSRANNNNALISPVTRHTNVWKWTKNVNIFQKDFIIIPINEHLHWFLAIICFPGLVGKVCGKKQTKYKTRRAKAMKLQVTDNQDQIALKRLPCILIFDSLAGSDSSARSVIANLRDYLSCEHMAKVETEVIFSEETMKGACPKVPQQRNFSDCGLYLLQYAECFFSDPITDFNLPIESLEEWFEEVVVNRKRKELANLIRKLSK